MATQRGFDSLLHDLGGVEGSILSRPKSMNTLKPSKHGGEESSGGGDVQETCHAQHGEEPEANWFPGESLQEVETQIKQDTLDVERMLGNERSLNR